MRVLIVDDEPLAQNSLAGVLGARSDVESFDVANDGVEALEKLRQEAYDVLLLDINIPSLSGMELIDQHREDHHATPAIIFVTAHQEHAIAAFRREAVDYVLKPFSTERLNEALERAVQQNATQRAMKLLGVPPMLQNKTRPCSQRIAIKAKGRILFIDPLQIVSVRADGNYVLLQEESRTYILRESITDLADKLRPYGFIRIHRSALVNGAMVEEIFPNSAGACRVRTRGGQEFIVARSYRSNLKYLAEFWIGSEDFLLD